MGRADQQFPAWQEKPSLTGRDGLKLENKNMEISIFLKSVLWSSFIQKWIVLFLSRQKFGNSPQKIQIATFPYYWIKLLDLIATISSTLILRSLLATEPAAASVELVSSFLTNIANLNWPAKGGSHLPPLSFPMSGRVVKVFLQTLLTRGAAGLVWSDNEVQLILWISPATAIGCIFPCCC